MTQRTDAPRLDPQIRHRDIDAVISPLDVAGMLRVLWHGKWLLLGVMMFTLCVAGYYAFRIASPQYSATTTLQLGDAGMVVSDDAALNTSATLVTSDAVLGDVITALDLQADREFNRYLTAPRPLALNTLRTQVRHWLAGTTQAPPDAAAVRDKTIQNLRSTLTVTRQPDTYILRITARSRDADKAVTLANTTAALYLTHVATAQTQKRAETEIWLQARVTDLRSQLEQQDKEAAAIIASAQIQGDGGLDALTAQVLAADQDLSAARNTLLLLQTAPDSGSARNTAEIVQLRSKINDLIALKDRRSAQLSTQSAGHAALNQIALQAETTRRVYQNALAELQDNRMQQGLQTATAQRTAPATEGTYAGPQKVLILEIAALLGAGIGIMAVTLRHTTRRGIIDARTLRDATGLPVLAQFSNRTLRRLGKGADLSQTGRRLYSALALTPKGGRAKVIVSTSSIAGEGKTHHALILAQMLGLSGKRVVLIGADALDPLLRSTIGAAAFHTAKTGWCSGEPAAQIACLGADVLIIPDAQNQHAPLLSDLLAHRLESLRKTYDHIIIDAPPVLLAPEAQLLASQSDAIIYAVRWSKTPRDLMQRGLAALDDVGHPATGMVLSRINLRKMRQWSNDPYIGAIATT